ncbi:CHAP domain-containing protein [Kutzneria buriramensis]|uniref:CHAP domain-containing protein n=1 Tax=Kutzneria buriramensis TaxID=1045776 RepID=A0A3E0HVP2_9PSEU|nr:CHAP domain-containing protein [Kutzneria buriramensis]REH50035.1 CHAP domain-containing protein [Kutzneria buriramensis]
MSKKTRALSVLASLAVLVPAAGLLTATAASAGTPADIASIAAANLGKKACSTNTAGGVGYGSSCTGSGGSPEFWCSDFAKWVWAQAGANVTGLTAGAGSFAIYGAMHDTPHVGDAVLFNYSGNGYADHVAIVTGVSGGNITTIGGDENGVEGNWAATSTVVQDSNYSGAIGYSSKMGMNISGYVSPRGVTGGSTAPAPTGKVYDNIRYAATGGWQQPKVADPGNGIQAVASAAMPNGDLHVETLAGGIVYDNIRFASDGHWQGAQVADNGGHVDAIAVAAMPNGDLHLETLTGGHVYDNIRYAATGGWQGARIADNGATVSALSIAGMPNGDLHLETVSGGHVYDNIRFASDGHWQGAQEADNGATVSAVSAAAMPNGDLHVETLSNGHVYDNIRYAATSGWQGAKESDNGAIVNEMAITAMPNGDLHLETLVEGTVYDNIRYAADGSWQGAKVADNGGGVVAISIAGMPNGDMHLDTLA